MHGRHPGKNEELPVVASNSSLNTICGEAGYEEVTRESMVNRVSFAVKFSVMLSPLTRVYCDLVNLLFLVQKGRHPYTGKFSFSM